MISYDGDVFFGLVGDRDVVPDLDDFAAALRAALREQPVPRRKPARAGASKPRRRQGEAEARRRKPKKPAAERSRREEAAAEVTRSAEAERLGAR